MEYYEMSVGTWLKHRSCVDEVDEGMMETEGTVPGTMHVRTVWYVYDMSL